MSIDYRIAGRVHWTSADEGMNMANGNFFHLFRDVLGLPIDPDECCGTIDPADVIAAVNRWRRAVNNGQADEFTRPAEALGNILDQRAEDMALGEDEVRVAQFFIGGLDRDYIDCRVEQIGRIAHRAYRNGKMTEYC